MPTGFRLKKSLNTERVKVDRQKCNDSDGDPRSRLRNRAHKVHLRVEDESHRISREGFRKDKFDSKKRERRTDGDDRGFGVKEKSFGRRPSALDDAPVARGPRFNRGEKDDSRGSRDSRRSEGRGVSVKVRADTPGWKGRKRDEMQRKFEEDDSGIEKQSSGEARAPRHHRGEKDGSRGVRDSQRSEGRDLSVRGRADKLGLKGKKKDGVRFSDKCKGDADAELLEQHANVKGKSNQIAGQKLDKQHANWPDNSGRKIDGRKKSSDDVPADTDAPPRKRKRIRLDPYDISNKRLDDGVSDDEKAEKDVEKDIKISKNAQFRAIQPSPSILSFIEDNLLGRRRLIELQRAGYNVKLSAPLDNIPFSTSTERDRIEENMFRNKLEFFAAAKISSSFPPPVIPEIAFAGRSNVGKSSLLNALTRQWGVARTSDKPGHTQSINFFRLASKLCLVDLPGYGFAYAKEEVKDSWEELVKEYVSTRVGLQRVCLLIDTKWGMKPRDIELIDLMERSQTPYQIVLTKTDVVFPIDVARRAMQIQENLKANNSVVNPVMMVSSQSGAGVRSLRTVLAKLARFIIP